MTFPIHTGGNLDDMHNLEWVTIKRINEHNYSFQKNEDIPVQSRLACWPSQQKIWLNSIVCANFSADGTSK